MGTLGYIKQYFEQNYKSVIEHYFTASQEYLSDKVLEKYDQLNFWTEHWCRSFKQHCLPNWYLRYFVSPSIPPETKVLVFHGDPKIDNAVKGVWSDKVPLYKKLYKKNLAMPSLKQFWE